MDHFNSTIRDGELVSTRRGLQVSRQKFNGLSFVNAYPQDAAPDVPFPSPALPDQVRPPQRQFKFVEKDKGHRQWTSKAMKKDIDVSGADSVSDNARGRRSRKRMATIDQPLAASSVAKSSSDDGYFQFSASTGSQDIRQFEPAILGVTGGFLDSAGDLLSAGISEENWRLAHRHLALVPRKIYPYEDLLTYNPAKRNDFYDIVVTDLAALHSVLMCGTISAAVGNVETDPKGLDYYISMICSILNQKLNQNKAVEPVTLLCIATLALMGCYVGRLDHWHMHMRGLQEVLDVNGGLGGLSPWLLAYIHKTDLKGAVALASSPYLVFTHKYDPISTIVPAAVSNYTFDALAALLNPLNVNTAVTESLSSLSVFSSAVRLARSSSGTVKFDPHAFTDECLAVINALVTQPAPLRAKSFHTTNPYNAPPDIIVSSSGGGPAVARTENYMANHRLRRSVPIVPADLGPGGPVEPALRIAGLLFIKELLPDWPRNVGGYAVLLGLLNEHLGEMLREYGTGGARRDGFRGKKEDDDDEGNEAEDEDEINDGNVYLIDPMLRDRKGKQHERMSHFQKGKELATESPRRIPIIGQEKPSTMVQQLKASPMIITETGRIITTTTSAAAKQSEIRPVIIWLCLLGDLISRIGDENECRRGGTCGDGGGYGNDDDDDRYPRDIYRDCLMLVAGLRTEEDVDILTDAEDLVIMSLLDLGDIIIQNNKRGVVQRDLDGTGAEDGDEGLRDRDETGGSWRPDFKMMLKAIVLAEE